MASDWSKIPARDNRGTVLIRTNWVDDEGPQNGTGTGFVISSEGHILTVAHQFPSTAVSVVLQTGETESWSSTYERQSFNLKLLYIDRAADFAVLVPTKSAVLVALPLVWNWTPSEGAEVNVRGFPLGGPLEGMSGSVRRNGLYSEVPTSLLLRAGHSGAPVYDSSGKVVCMVRGGIPVVDVQDPTVMGLGFCVPLSLLKAKMPSKLLEVVAASEPSSGAIGGGGEIRVSYPVNTVKTTSFSGPQDLLKPMEREAYSTGRIEAQSGYRIAKYDYAEHSATKVSDREVKIAPDGSYLEMTYKLTSGPGFDRWRGWLVATLVTIQVPKE